jgi:hypothetical protein
MLHRRTSLRLVPYKQSPLALGLQHLCRRGLQIESRNLRSLFLKQTVAFSCPARHSERMDQIARYIHKLEKCQHTRIGSKKDISIVLTLTQRGTGKCFAKLRCRFFLHVPTANQHEISRGHCLD